MLQTTLLLLLLFSFVLLLLRLRWLWAPFAVVVLIVIVVVVVAGDIINKSPLQSALLFAIASLIVAFVVSPFACCQSGPPAGGSITDFLPFGSAHMCPCVVVAVCFKLYRFLVLFIHIILLPALSFGCWMIVLRGIILQQFVRLHSLVCVSVCVYWNFIRFMLSRK